MKSLKIAALVSVLAAPGVMAQGQSYVIRGGTVHTMAGAPIDGGTVVLENGRIAAVGVNVSVPTGATVIDAAGLHIYPGLFNAFSHLGLREINAVTMTNDIRELGNFNPHLVAATAVHPASERIPVTRANGVTHVVTVPSADAGGIAGQASAIHLDGWTVEEMLIRHSVGMVFNWPSLQTRRFNFQTFSVDTLSFKEVQKEYDEGVERLRDWLDDARRYRQAVAPGNAPSRNLKLEAMSRIVSRDLPLLVLADDARVIRSVVEFAGEEDLRIVLVGARDAWKEKELLAEKDIPVLLRATQNMPATRDEPYHITFSAPAQLYEAGVRFAMTGWASSGPNPPSRTLAYEAANAVPYGLPQEEALKAVTRYPAEILGLDDDLGTIEEGKLGNVIVTDGDPLQIRTQIVYVFIAGHPVSTDNKHRSLYEKYRARR